MKSPSVKNIGIRPTRSAIMLMTLFLLVNCFSASNVAFSERNGEAKNDARALMDHLVINEVKVKPGNLEFIEIMNPTDNTISLDNYYIADITDYYNITNLLLGFNQQLATDFIASFPTDSTISPWEHQIIAFDEVGFIDAYSIRPNYILQEGFSPRMNETRGFIGGSASLTDSGETLVLFYWDGVMDLVRDVDIVWWGNDEDYKVDKSGVSIDSDLDGDLDESTYANDASTFPPIHTSAHPEDNSFTRIAPMEEAEEIPAGGNGKTGHDETTENLTISFWRNITANPTVTSPVGGPPIMTSLKKTPVGDNPGLGENVTFLATVIDEGSVTGVEINISIDGKPYQSYPMIFIENATYGYVLVWNEAIMERATSVKYNISAEDDHGNVTRSGDMVYYYLPAVYPDMLIHEVMFKPDNEASGWKLTDCWVELLCLDDNNLGLGNTLMNWGTNDLEGEMDKVFGNILVRTGESVLVHFNSDSMDEWNATDGNNDMILDTYSEATNTRLDDSEDQLLLYDPDGMVLDAVCWAGPGELEGSEEEDLNVTFDLGHWDSKNYQDCVDSESVEDGKSISRSVDEQDSNTKNDWYIMDRPNPGTPFNKSDLAPFIGEVILTPEAEMGILKPNTNITLEVNITDELELDSAELIWSLEGINQPNILLENNGAGADISADDNIWTCVIPGKELGTSIIFKLMARDIGGQITFSNDYNYLFFQYPEIIITEIMLEPEAGEDWVELYCANDANSGDGNILLDWELTDMESTRYEFGATLVRTGDYLLIHFDDDVSVDEGNATGGNDDGIIDLYTDASSGIMATTGDQLVLYNEDDIIMDAIAWQRDGTLKSGEITDMEELKHENAWNSSVITGCFNLTGIDDGISVARRYHHSQNLFIDTDTKDDWYLDNIPSPGMGGHSPPPDFNFTVLTNSSDNADKSYRINWEWKAPRVNDQLSFELFYRKGNSTPVKIADAIPEEQNYLWNTAEVVNGSYFLIGKVNYSSYCQIEKITDHPLVIVHVPVYPPEIVSSWPADGGNRLPVNVDIAVEFDRAIDRDSFILGTTFIITPTVQGSFSLEDDVKVIFDPSNNLDYDTLYSITIKDVESNKGRLLLDEYHFTFKTEVQPTFNVKGSISPETSTVEIDGEEIDVDKDTFEIRLVNGSHDIVISSPGYTTHVDTFFVNGLDMILDDIVLQKTVKPPKKFKVEIGPFLMDGESLKGVRVWFTLNDTYYENTSGNDGKAVFWLEMESLPDGVKIYGRYEEDKVEWTWGNENPYDAFENREASGNKEGNKTLWTILIILMALIIIVALAMVIYAVKSKKEDEAEPEKVEIGDQGEEEAEDKKGGDENREAVTEERAGDSGSEKDGEEGMDGEESGEDVKPADEEDEGKKGGKTEGEKIDDVNDEEAIPSMPTLIPA